MAEKLSITIALEGGKAIEQQLEGIGKAGQKAFEDIAKAAEKAGGFKNLKPEEVTQKLKDMGVVGKDALDKITGAVRSATQLERLVGMVQSVENGFANVGAAATSLGRVLGPLGVLAAATLGKLVTGAIDSAKAISEIDKAAIKAGLSISKFDQLRQGFEAAGLSAKGVAAAMSAISEATKKGQIEQVAKDLERLQADAKLGLGVQLTDEFKRLVETGRGVGEAAEKAQKALKELGFTIAPSAAKSLAQMIATTGDAVKGTIAFIEQLRRMPDSANRSALAIDGFKEAGAELVQSLRTGAITEDQFKERLGGLAQPAANTANQLEQSLNRMSSAWTRFQTSLLAAPLAIAGIDLVTAGIEKLNSLFSSNAFSEWAAALDAAVSGLIAKIGELASALGGAIWDTFLSAGTAAINGIMGLIDSLIAKLQGIGSAISAIAAGGGTPGDVGPIPGNARGGLLRGRGSGTSDSNLAWVSRGEHIMPANAVRQPGVLALLEALRRSGGNLSHVLDGMGRFAAGGVVPRFAAGGLVGGMGHLGTVDLRTDHGSVTLMASGSAVEQLSRLAVTKRMTSTGRKPGFIG